jgi:hypothetical protein
MEMGPARWSAKPRDNTRAMSNKSETGFKSRDASIFFIRGAVLPGLD